MFLKVLSSLRIAGKSAKKFHLLWRSTNGGKAANHATVGIYNGGTTFQILRVPLSTKKISIIQWYPLIDKIMARINSWTAKKLSYAGRTQLIKTVLFGVQSYWAQLFIILAKIIKVIEGLCRSYLWSGVGYVTKKALIAWEKVCCPKSEGGIGLINMKK